MKQRYRVSYRKFERIYEIKLYDFTSESTVMDCYHGFREIFDKTFDGQHYKILSDFRGYRHDNIPIERKIRELFSSGGKPETLEKCAASAIVNDDIDRMHAIQDLYDGGKERFFSDMDAALAWLSGINVT